VGEIRVVVVKDVGASLRCTVSNAASSYIDVSQRLLLAKTIYLLPQDPSNSTPLQ
jgi:hypothetical protein